MTLLRRSCIGSRACEKQLAEANTVLDGERRVLDPEVGLGNLVLIELAERNRLTVQGGGDVLERCSAISAASIASCGQPKGVPRSVLRISVPLIPAPIVVDHLLADRVLLGGVGMADGLEG